MRFSDEEYLRAWRDEKVWPKIHNNIYNLVASTCEATSVLDLCACTGLLGQRLQDTMGLNVVAIEGDAAWIDRGNKWGTNIPTLHTWVYPETMPAIITFIQKHEVTGIVARRCLSELFGNDRKHNMLSEPNWEWATEFSRIISDAGVTEFWVEGRAEQGRSVHPIPNTTMEAACLESHFEVRETYNKCAYLTLR